MTAALVLTLTIASFVGETTCRAPKFQLGTTVVDTRETLYVAASIKLDDFAPNRLVCLAAVLRKQYSGRVKIFVPIFSDSNAAKSFRGIPDIDRSPPGSREADFQRYALQHYLHGLYSYDVTRNEEYIVLKPLSGIGDLSSDVRINLPFDGASHCHQISGRCLLSSDPIEYPVAMSDDSPSQSVTIQAMITREGNVTNARNVGSPAESAVALQFLQETLANIRTWRFEPTKQVDTLQLTYHYRVAPDLWRGIHQVQFNLPNSVVLSAGTRVK